MIADDPDRQLLIRLVSDVFRLREVIHRSEEDSKLRGGDDPIKFNYLVDTPVFQYFAQPERLAHYVSALPILQIPESEEDVGYVVESVESAIYAGRVEAARKTFEGGLANSVRHANAVLTIEHIFGGVHARPVLISPDHVREITGYIAKAEVEAGRGSIPEDARRNRVPGEHRPGGYLSMRQGLTEVLRTMQAGKRSPDEAIELLNSQVIAVLQRATYMAAVPRIDELMGREILANAASNPAYTREIIAPAPKLVDDWVKRVKAAKRGNRKQPTELAFEADGAALAQLSLLNARWKETREVFILITDDHGLHNACKSWMRERRDAGEEPFHPLRYCKQFAPILNVKDMGGAYDPGYIFVDIRRAVFQFADTFMTGDAPLNHANGQDLSDASHVPSAAEIGDWLKSQFRLAVDAPPALSKALPARVRDLEHEIKTISALWIKAMRMVVLAKVDVLLDYAEKQLEDWREKLQELEFDRAFRANIGNLTNAFDKSTAASTMLRHEFYVVEMAPQAEDSVADHGRRIVASTFSAFKSLVFQDQTIETLTQKIAKHKSPLDFLAKAETEERWLVLGALCLEIGAWRGAVSILTHAHDNMSVLGGRQQRRTALAAEIEFFRCVARRVSASHATWSREYKEIRAILTSALEKDPDDLAGARVVSELFALSVSAFAWTLSNQDEKEIEVAIAQASGLWNGPIGAALRAGDGSPTWARLRSQICLNVLVLAFWSIQIQGALDPRLAEIVDFAVAEIEHPERDPTHHALHLPIYPALLRFASIHDGLERIALATDLIGRLDAVLLRDQEMGYAFEVANVDKAEFRKIRSILVKAGGSPRLAAVSPTAP